MTGLLSRDTVMLHLTYLATALRRKIDQRVIDIYHRECGRTMDDDQFTAAVAAVLDEDDKFPAISRLKAIGKGQHRRERGTPYIVGAGPLADCLADVDAERSYGGDDQFRGRTYTKPAIERLVYEDAAATVKQLPGEGLSAWFRRIALRAEAEIGRMEASAIPIAIAPEPQRELDGPGLGQEPQESDSGAETGA